jgi:5'-deoxynucleotidase YfbR-like HD superfamily hydrolase
MNNLEEKEIKQKLFSNIIEFTNIFNIKFIFRSIELMKNRKESVADHCWKLSLLIILTQPYLDRKINFEKAIKMAIIHDLAEALIGDIPIVNLLKDERSANKKLEEESKIFNSLKDFLGEDLGEEILSLWLEFEENESYEANVVNALDKLEAQLQQNQLGITTWKELEKIGRLEFLESLCGFDSFIYQFKNEIMKRKPI